MKPLYLSGFSVSLSVDRARLLVRDGFHEPDVKPEEMEIQARNAPFDSVIIDGHSGYVTLDSLKWLMRHGIPLLMLDYDGTLLSSALPREPVNGPLKIAQFQAYNDFERRLHIAKNLIEAKAQRTNDILDWLDKRYESETPISTLNSEIQRLAKQDNLSRLMQVEGKIADAYWQYLQKILPAKFGFQSRMHESHQMNSSDQVNTLLNYGYAILESQVRKALNIAGLDPTIGFLHEARQTRYALAYDLMEPYRFLIDTTVISALEASQFTKKDFYRMDNYVLRLRPEGVRRLLDVLRLKFNSPVRYHGKFYGWDVIIRLKAQELAHYILNKGHDLDFINPRPVLTRDDTAAVRERILSLDMSEARRRGIGKTTLWHLKQQVRTGKPFRTYKRVESRLE